MKGFTLIELLAVIVILAIIALIATPLILNVIDDSKKGAFKSSAYGIIEAAELQYATEILGSDKEEKNYIYENGQLINNNGNDLNYKGNKPQNGEVRINKDGEIAIVIHNGKYCAEKTYDASEVKISETTKEKCKLILLPTGEVCGDGFVDERDGNTYKTVRIGNQCWMADNLRYAGNGCLTSGGENSCNLNEWKATPYTSCCYHSNNDGTELGPIENRKWTEKQVLYQWGRSNEFVYNSI
jgi:prepilin-type N-terminal cleavage/methylation domain-containing protein